MSAAAIALQIPPRRVEVMDPQQRLLLECGYISLHAASHRRSTLMGGDGGVFLGIERPDWGFAQPASVRTSVYVVTGDNVNVAAGRISFTLGMQGPCSTQDTGCSSTIVALATASKFVVQSGGCSRSVMECSHAVVLSVSLKLALWGCSGLQLQACSPLIAAQRRSTNVQMALQKQRVLGQ